MSTRLPTHNVVVFVIPMLGHVDTVALCLSKSIVHLPSEHRRAGDDEREDPDAGDDADGEALAPAHLVRDGPGDGQVAVDGDGAQRQDGGRAQQHVQRDPQVAQQPAQQPHA